MGRRARPQAALGRAGGAGPRPGAHTARGSVPVAEDAPPGRGGDRFRPRRRPSPHGDRRRPWQAAPGRRASLPPGRRWADASPARHHQPPIRPGASRAPPGAIAGERTGAQRHGLPTSRRAAIRARAARGFGQAGTMPNRLRLRPPPRIAYAGSSSGIHGGSTVLHAHRRKPIHGHTLRRLMRPSYAPMAKRQTGLREPHRRGGPRPGTSAAAGRARI